jgi:hypothetical protein
MCEKNRDKKNKINKIDMVVKDKSELDLELLVLLALGYLEGNIKKVYTEEIAVQLWKWNPKDCGFKLEKYSGKYPDKEKPRRGLMKLRSYEWAIGSSNERIVKDGWQLTTEGIEYYEKIKHMHDDKKINTDFSKKELSLVKKKIGDSKLYKKYIHSQEHDKKLNMNQYDLEEFFRTPFELKKEMRKRFFEYHLSSEHTDMKEYTKFLECIKNEFEDIFDKKIWIDESRTHKKRS